MEAVLLRVAGFLPQLKSWVVGLMCDNAMVVSYISKEGRTKSFRQTSLTIRLLKFCDWKGIRLVPVHLPGSHNRLTLGRGPNPSDWVGHHRQLLHPVLSSWEIAVIDLFVTFANRKLPVLTSPFPDPRAKYVDAMPIPWSGMGTVYALPPIKMLRLVLEKIRKSHDLSAILVASCLMSASWML